MIKGGTHMAEKKLDQPTVAVEENPDAIIKRLTAELTEVRKLAEKAISENQILRATIKAVTQLL